MRYAFLLLVCLITPLTQVDDEQKTIFGSWIDSDALHVAIPKDGKSIHAFSTRTGQWTHLTLKAKLPDDAVPIVGGEMALIQTKETIYAIGSRMKGWTTLKLKNPGTTAVLLGSSVRVEDGRHLFLIGAESEHWEGIDLDTGSVLLPPNGG